MRFVKFFPSFLLAFLSVSFLVPKFAMADSFGNMCYCYTDLDQATVQNNLEDDASVLNECKAVLTNIDCESFQQTEKANNASAIYVKCDAVKYQQGECAVKMNAWTEQRKKILVNQKNFANANTSVVGKFIPACLLETTLSQSCRDISIFFVLAINVSNYLFSIIGGIALLMFIYGGFLMILSNGNAEKVESGKNAMVAAIIGLAIAFGGYMIVKYLGEAVKLKDQFRLK